MITLIGKQNCSACNMAKNILKNNNIKFEYKLFENLTPEEQKKYLSIAKENNILSMPLIFNNNKITTLEEVIA